MIYIDTKTRSDREEIMDNFDLKGRELAEILKDLNRVNAVLGGNKVTINGIKKVLKEHPVKELRILDVGCGDGSMLREVAKFGRKKEWDMRLLGVDANEGAIAIAREGSEAFPEIQYEVQNIFSDEFKKQKFDLILCTLTLHHFKDNEIRQLLEIFVNSCRLGIVINDLQRSRTAYRLFKLFSAVFLKKEIAKKDGLTSILRGFKQEDLKAYGHNLDVSFQEINWKWAFRYQWVLIK